MKRLSVLFATMCLLFLSDVGLQALDDTPHYEQLTVQQIEVTIANEPADEARQSAVLQRLKTKNGSHFSQEDFDEDLKTLAKEFDRVEPKIDVVNGQLYVRVELWLKPTIAAITWQGAKGLTEDRLAKELGIRSGMLFDRQNFTKAFHKLKSLYIKKGYFEAELDYTVHRQSSENKVDIVIHINEGRSGQVEKIVFHNLTSREEDEILERILTKEYSFFTSWITDEGTHNPDVLRQDELTIINFLQNEGYADVKVTASVVPSKKSDRIIIDIDVQKGSLYHFAGVSVNGNSVFTADELLKRIPVKLNEIYSPEKIRDSVRILQNMYGVKGYIDAQVSHESTLSSGANTYAVRFDISEGERFRIGLIRVFGNTRTDTSVILHEIPLTPGEVFDSTLLQKAEERLRNIGFFKNVNVYAVRSATSGSAFLRDVYVEVEENPTTAQIHFFLTFNSTESLSGGVQVNESNFNSKGLLTPFSKGLKGLRGGGEYLSVNATVGKKQLVYSLAWTKPYFMDSPWIVGFEATKLRNEYASQDYTIRAYNFSVFGDYPINAFVKAGLQYRLNHSFIRLRHSAHDSGNRALVRESKNGGLISAFGPKLSYDSTDHPSLPRRGMRSSLSAEYAGFGGDHQFLKAAYLNSLYWAPYQYGLFRFRANAQFIQTLGSTHPKDLPFAERFFMGGDTSIRGYRYNTVGPHFHDKFRTPRGGMSSLLVSAEYDQYLFKKIDAFVFLDAGNAYFKQLYVGDLRFSAGYGLKLKVLGSAPIVFGVGHPLNPQSKKDLKKFFFSLGTAF